jgi:hypothetical protein
VAFTGVRVGFASPTVHKRLFFEQSPKSDFAIAAPSCFLSEGEPDGSGAIHSPGRVPTVAAGEHPSAVAKHDEPTRILFDTDLVDRPSALDIGVPTKDLLDTFTILLEKLDRVSCNVGRHRPDSHSRTGTLPIRGY